MGYKQELSFHWLCLPFPEDCAKASTCRNDLIGIFPTTEPIIRLVGALMLEANDEWTVARRYAKVHVA